MLGSLVQVQVVIVNVFHQKCLAGVELDSVGCLCLDMVDEAAHYFPKFYKVYSKKLKPHSKLQLQEPKNYNSG